MYQQVIVPLDGSELAECVLPHVEAIAKGCGVKEVVFIRSVEPTNIQGVYFSQEDLKRIDAESMKAAQAYMEKLAKRVKFGTAKVKTEIVTGRAADSLPEYARDSEADLIVIATHGRSGISRWVWGSVADHLLRSACVPILMVRAPGCIPGI